MRAALVGLLAGLVGFAIAWSAWHVYIDHQDLHALIAIERSRQATGK